jgi:pimeloyl-ACP methyl ester carboxylesterase
MDRTLAGSAMRELTVRTDDGVELHVRELRPRGPRAPQRNRATQDAAELAAAARARDLPPFLLVHGLSSNARLWDGVAARLAAAGHHVVAVDQRAHGRSAPSDDLAFARLVADLAHVIDRVELDRPVAVGQSWGGNVVLELGAERPDLVRGVVGVDGGLIELARRFPSVEECWAALAPPSFDGLSVAQLEQHVRARHAGWPDGSAEAQLGNFARDAPDAPARAILARERHRNIVEQLHAHRPLERLARLEVRMLLLAVTGGVRRVVDEERLEAARAVAARGLDVVRLPGRDHDVHLQEPDTVARLVRDWSVALPEPTTIPEVV